MSDVTDVQVPILRRHLQELKLHDGVWSGYLTTEDDVKQLERSLAAANVKFSVRSSRRKPGNIVFNSANGGVPIYLDLVPFRVTGDATKQCIFGDEYYKKSDAHHQDETAADWQGIKKKRLQLQGTKKKGCKATMHLKYIELYPEHKVELPQLCGRIKKNNFKASKAKELGEALQCERDIASEKRVYVAISDF